MSDLTTNVVCALHASAMARLEEIGRERVSQRDKWQVAWSGHPERVRPLFKYEARLKSAAPRRDGLVLGFGFGAAAR